MGNILEILKLSVATLWENRLRSVLTLLGMIFGNAAIIATLSSNEGAKAYIAQQLASLGNKLITITTDSQIPSEKNLEVLRNFADELELATTERVFDGAQIRAALQSANVSLVAVSAEYFKAMNLEISNGRLVTDSEANQAMMVCLLGHHARVSLFGDKAFIDKYIELSTGGQSVMIRVIGAFKEKGGAFGATLDQSIFVSPQLGRKLAKFDNQKVIAMLKDDNRSEMAKDQVMGLWSSIFGDTLRVIDAREAISRTRAIWSKQNFVGICLAGISLLTGGVGIMNIMLLSIHQRRREIGIRKAVGARNSQIATQFLIETILVCLIGSIIGIVIGWGFGQKVASLLGDWKASMSLGSICLAMVFSVLTGLVFGAAPAVRAAKIDPYDALRAG